MSSLPQYKNIEDIQFNCTIADLITNINTHKTIIDKVPSTSSVSDSIIKILNKIRPLTTNLNIFIHLNIMCDLLGLDKTKISNIYEKYNSIVPNDHEIIKIDKSLIIEHIIRLYVHDYLLYMIKQDIIKKMKGINKYEYIIEQINILYLLYLHAQTLMFIRKKSSINFRNNIEDLNAQFISKLNTMIEFMRRTIKTSTAIKYYKK